MCPLAHRTTRKPGHLPRNLLTEYSTFFGAALEGGFAESISNALMLPDDDLRVFEHFIQLQCLSNRIDCPNSTVWCCVRDQIRTWILADKIGCPILQNAVTVHLIEDLHGGLINEVNLKMMYDESAPGSKLRQLAVDQILYDAKCGQLEDREQLYVDLAGIIQEFAKDITKTCLRMVSGDFKDPTTQREKYLGDLTFEIDAS